MNLLNNNLAHVNCIAHDGKVLLFGVDPKGIIWYTVKQSGFEDSVFNESPDTTVGYEVWKKLPLGESTYDASAAEKFTSLLVPVFGKDQANNENPQTVTSALAPVQLVSGMGHLYVFRQSTDNKLLVNRFVLDGMKNELSPKLDVRFKRSRQKYQISDTMKREKNAEGQDELTSLDSLDFKDMDGNPFYEPTWKMDFIENLHQGWFAAVLLPTLENEKYRWSIFAYDSVAEKVILYTIRASHSAIFDIKDYAFIQPDPKDSNKKIMRTIPGIIKRALDIKSESMSKLIPFQGLAATVYDLQKERIGDDGEPQLLKDATRVMLAVPVKQENSNASDGQHGNIAAVSFAVASDGTLSQVDQTPESQQLYHQVNELVLPLNTLEDVKEYIDTTPAPSGVMTGVQKSSDGTVTILSTNIPDTFTGGGSVKISGTKHYNGLHRVVNVIEEKDGSKSFEIEATFINSEAGFWEAVPQVQNGLTFENMVVGHKKAGDGLLKITCSDHSLEIGDEVQVTGTRDYDGLYPIRGVDEINDSFTIDMDYQFGEAVDLKAKKRRAIRFEGGEDYLRTGSITLDVFKIDEGGGRTMSIWVWLDRTKTTSQLIARQEDHGMELWVNSEGCLELCVHLSDGNDHRVRDLEALPIRSWVHCAGIIKYQTETSAESHIYMCKNGVKITPVSAFGNMASESEKTVADCYPVASMKDAFVFGDQSSAGSTAERVMISRTIPARALTAAFWVKTTSRGADLLNYTTQPSSSSIQREFSVINPNNLRIYVGQSSVDTDVSINDGDWHHLAVAWESEKGVLTLYKDGASVFSATDFKQGYNISQSETSALVVGGSGSTLLDGALGEVSIWSTVLSLSQVARFLEKRITGDENYLVGAWVHGGYKAYDLSPRQAHGILEGNVGSLNVEKLDKLRPVRLLVGGEGKEKGSFSGKLSELKIWNIAQDEKTINDGMHMPLRSQEDQLAGNWRMGAISLENGLKLVPDFSTYSNYAFVYGSPFVSERSLNRKTGADEKVVRYASDDLVAVSQRARYRESFEFRVQAADGDTWTLDKLNDADGMGNNVKLFQFAYWGKASRGSEKKIDFTHDMYSQDEFVAAAGAPGWFQASCDFTVPDGVAMVRTFDLCDVRGLWRSEEVPPVAEWSTLEIRKHRIEQISDSITRKDYCDEILVVPTGSASHTNLYALQDEIRSLEVVEANTSLHLQNLMLRIDVVEHNSKYDEEKSAKEDAREDALAQLRGLASRESALRREISWLDRTTRSRSLSFDRQIRSLNSKYQYWRSQESRLRNQLKSLRKKQWIPFYGIYVRTQIRGVESDLRKAVSKGRHYRSLKAGKEAEKGKVLSDLSDSKERCNKEKKGIATLKVQIQSRERTLRNRINLLASYLANMEELSQLEEWKSTTQESLSSVRVTLGTKNNDFLNALAEGQLEPQCMAQVSKDSQMLVTLGALLTFVSPQSRLHALVSARGNVELSYFDTKGKMQCTVYDATADSRNTTFEQWLPRSLQSALEFREPNDKMIVEHVEDQTDAGSISDKWTIETWFQYPLIAQASGDVYETQVLLEDERGRKVVVKEGRFLGAEANDVFFETGIDLSQVVEPGWHHLAITVEREQGLAFFLDGNVHGSTPKKYAMAFNGDNTNDYIEWSSFANFPSTSFTVAMWVKTDGQNSEPTPLSYWTTGANDTFHLRDVNPLKVDLGGSSLTTTVYLNDGAWHHLAVTWESFNGALSVYKDGELINSEAGFKLGYSIPDGGTLVLGQKQCSRGGGFNSSQSFEGHIRGFSIWDVARSVDDITRDMYTAFRGAEANLVGYWPMETSDEGGSLVVKDVLAVNPQPGEVIGELNGDVLSVTNESLYVVSVIGNSVGGGAPFGRLAQMRFWKQLLSEEEISANARANFLTGNEPGLGTYLPMNEASGDTVRDYGSGLKKQVVLSGAEWKACTGEMGGRTEEKGKLMALSFDGTNTVEIPGLSRQLGGDELTIEYWFRGEHIQSAVRQQSITEGAYIIAGWGGTGSLFPGYVLSNDSNTTHRLPMGDVQNSQWHHVAMTWKKGASNGFKAYLDGAVVSEKNASSRALPAITASLFLGSYQNSKEYTSGQLAEVRIWKTRRSKEEIMANMHRRLTGNETGLEACYPLDAIMEHEESIKVRDITPNNYHGTVNGATLVEADDLFMVDNIERPQALYFGGTGRGAECSDIDIANKSFSLECWVKNFKVGSDSFFFTQGSRAPYQGLHIGYRRNNRLTFSLYTNHIDTRATYTDTDWHHIACTFDVVSRQQTLYRDGEQVGQRTVDRPYTGSGTFYFGGLFMGQNKYVFKGYMDEVRAWDHVLSQNEIQEKMNRRLSGKESGLIAYWPTGQLVDGKLEDKSAEGTFDCTVSGAEVVEAPSGLPFPTGAPDFTTASISSCEYATIGLDPDKSGARLSMLRSFRAYSDKQGHVDVLADQRIEALELKWVGNAQFQPTLLGFIEGPPPVPSENLTVDYDYNDATSVTLRESQDVSYTWNRTKDTSQGADVDMFVGGSWSVSGGIGIETRISEGRVGFKGSLNTRFVDSKSSNVTGGSTISFNDTLALRGEQERGTKFPYLGKRYIPKNVGYALVVSGLADVFISRLARSHRMISYEMRPVEGVPLDINTITFQINSAYTMNGTLDGLTGSQPASDRFFNHVPEMREQYGSLYPASYYRIKEAYNLKRQIEQWDKDREAYFWNFDVTWRPGVEVDRQYADADDDTYGQVSVEREEDEVYDSDEEDVSEEQRTNEKIDDLHGDMEKEKDKAEAKAMQRQDEINKRFGDAEARERATAGLDGWQSKMDNLLIRAGKRNIVNTYVWDANGGLRVESQDYANTVEHTIGSNFTLGGTLGGLVDTAISAFKMDLTMLYAGELTQTSSKTENIGKTFGLDVDLFGLESKQVTDLDGKPLFPAEKVGRYRFMSYYLGGNTDNFHDFFDYVVDPEWLASNSEGARALRQAKAAKPNKAWRVLHRVTYVERPALEGVGIDSRPTSGEDQVAERTVNYFDSLEKKNLQLQADINTVIRELREQREMLNELTSASAGGAV